MESTFLHGKYSMNTGAYYDVGLIKLRYPIKIDNKTTKVIPMFAAGEESKRGDIVHTAGWGRLSVVGSRSDQLKSTQMKVVGCLIINGTDYDIYDDWLCTVTLDKNRDTSLCKSDSGGPAVINDKLAGVAHAASLSCSTLYTPNEFTPVASFREWIDARVG